MIPSSVYKGHTPKMLVNMKITEITSNNQPNGPWIIPLNDNPMITTAIKLLMILSALPIFLFMVDKFLLKKIYMLICTHEMIPIR